jgi:hypothetical protein
MVVQDLRNVSLPFRWLAEEILGARYIVIV